MIKNTLFITALSLTLNLSACGGSSGSGEDKSIVVFEGELTEGKGHKESLKHGVGEGIEEVEICALGKCSRTDSNGNFGFGAPESYQGGDVEISVSGHNTDAKTIVKIPTAVNNVFVHLERQGPSEVIVHHLMIDGKDVD